MHSARKLAAAALVVVMALALFAVVGTPSGASRGTVAAVLAPDAARGLQLPFSSTLRYFDPTLKDATGRVGVLVAMQSTAPTAEVARFLSAARAIPSIGDVRLVRGTIDASLISELQSSPYVLGILKDRPMFDSPKTFGIPARMSADSRLLAKFQEIGLQALQSGPIQRPQLTAIERDSLMGGPEVTMRDVVNFTGARRAWTQLGVDGTGVTIAVVDTGVDHGTFNLGNGSAARGAGGLPSSFDPDGSTFAWTTITATSYVAGPSTFISTSGTDPLIWVFIPGGGPLVFLWSDFFAGAFPSDIEITGISPSKSGVYHFGVLNELSLIGPSLYLNLYPVVVVDTAASGAYDTAYLDLSFNWWLWGFGPPSPDFSIADEPMLRPAGGNVVAARDMNADGYPDISAGSLTYYLDIWGVAPNPADLNKVLRPLDPNGDFIAMLYDWQGHGTSVASSAAGRESNHPLAGPGTGPGARIMGVPIFNWFDIIDGWLWAAGFDLAGTASLASSRFVPNYGPVYGEWTYTGNHKADIISNSWGASDWLTFPWAYGWPWYDVLTVIEDALMTPGYASPAYPGTVMVHAGGNGAAGYGTVTEPGFNSLAITTGASTNLNYTSLPFGGFHGDVISWSARGPNAYGVVKPDVLQVGAFAWASAPVWYGFLAGGDGFYAYTLFGGTSQATPVTSGSAAVVIQAYQVGHGVRPSPFTVKSILKSTALDLGYDAFVQGAGHVDVYNAAAYAKGNKGILTTTPATWDNLRPRVASPWASASVFYGQQIGVSPPAGPIPDTSWFAGSVHPGGSTSASFTIAPAAGTVSGSISAVYHSRLAASITLTGTTTVLGGGWLEGFGQFAVLSPSSIPAISDLMVVRGIMPYNYLDTNGDYNWDNRSRIIVGDWVDNGNSIIEPSEVKVFNYGYNAGTTVEARVGLPNGRFSGLPLLWFSQAPRTGVFVPMPFTIQVEFYDRVPWTWISAPSTFTASAASPATWTATLSVPAGTSPGVYEGQIIVSPTGGNATAVPVSVIVPATIDAATLSTTVTSAGSTQIYDPSSVNGYFDWRWRYEAGDWKLWFVDVTDPTTVALRADVSWTGSKTDVDIWSLGTDSIPDDSSFSMCISPCSGAFVWNTRTGTTSDWVVASTQIGFGQTSPGVYTFALHNVLLDTGGAVPEALTGKVSAAKLSPRSPVTVVTQPGKTVSVPLTLSTGFDLSSISIGLAAPPPFLSTVSPSFTPALAAGGSLTTWFNATVPAGAADGVYQNFLFLSASPGIFTLVVVNIVVDSTNPVVSILAPATGAYVKGTVTIQAAVADANNAASVSFTVGSASGAMTKDPVTGLWTASWVTTGTPDGNALVSVKATDTAGNQVTSTRGVVVDNTAPTATFSSPLANAFVRGTVTATFSVVDANLATATLVYGGTSVDVTGAASAPVNTATLGDGARTLTLTAVDKAGNSRTATLTVDVDNTAPTATIVSPQAGAFLKGTVAVSVVATDANLGTANLTIGTAVFPVTGATVSINTASIADGAKTMTLTVSDMAGNTATDSASVTIDNTAPAVSISAPSTNANLRGAITVTWSVTETNPDKVWLTIDGEQRDVSGTTSYTWDTSSVGDGAHSIEIRAIDKAGNVGTSTVSVTTDNVAAAVSTGFTNGLLIGLVAAAVAGFLIGWFVGRRRKKEELPSLETPLPPTKKEEL